MPSHGTASSERNQFAQVLAPVTVALAAALDDLDPKEVIRKAEEGQALRTHLRNFFVPPVEQRQGTLPEPRWIVPVCNIPVNHGRKWEEAIQAGGPNTPADYDVRKVGDLWVARRQGIIPTDFTLVNFPADVESEQVLKLARLHQWGRPMDPVECLAVAEHRPKLHRDLGLNEMAVVSLDPREFQGESLVVSVWFLDARREACLLWFACGWSPRCWFGFVRES